jgi:two-component system nitrogen regulation response regulator GlnG/two-component system response regulator HydG
LHRGEIHVDRIGSCSTSVNGQRLSSGTLRAGDTIMLRDQLVLVCVERPVRMPPMISFPMDAANSFGLPDALGMVGESVTAWKLRDDISFVAGAAGHILVLEESGVGKEVAAHAIHAFSGRGARKLVARSAATIPDSLIDAELFGNVGNYPNPGMRDRPGLIGESDQSALLLDEIGELPPPLQSRLLRVLDNGGEYSPLGEAKSRKADFRLIAATNRGAVELKHDFAARFTLRVEIPGMNVRREDIPLLIALLLKRAGQTTPDVARRYFEADDKKFARPRIAPNLIAYLVRHTYSLEMHELESLLWKAMLTSPGGFIGLTPDVRAEFEHSEVSEAVKPAEVTQEAVTESVQRHDGNITRAAKQLGLKTVTCSNA